MKINIKNSIIDINDALDRILPLYNFEYNNVNCRLLKHCINDTYKLTLDDKSVFILKIYSRNQKYHELVCRIKIIVLSKNYGAQISYPIRKHDGDYITEIEYPEGKRSAVLYSYSRGREQTYDNISESFRYGLNIAKLHNAIDSVLINNRPHYDNNMKQDFQNAISIVKGYLQVKGRKDNLECFAKITALVLAKLDTLDDLEMGYCHNDLHGGNAHVLGDYIEFFDLDFSSFYPRAYELAVFKWSCEVGKRYKQWVSFLNGYESIRNFNDIDKSYINLFLIVRDTIIFALDIEKTDIFGEIYLSRNYIHKRINFLKMVFDKYLTNLNS